MAHSHYVLDMYYANDGDIEPLRREVMRIEAHDDAEAIEEATRISGWRHPIRFDVRAISSLTRTGDRLVHSAPPIVEAQQAETPAGATIEDR
jgi:hypothetical protein